MARAYVTAFPKHSFLIKIYFLFCYHFPQDVELETQCLDAIRKIHCDICQNRVECDVQISMVSSVAFYVEFPRG